ncbi:UNVERIFIED_CONTAM: hypothetical protein FKN15_054254 [Acipenser sinensis]
MPRTKEIPEDLQKKKLLMPISLERVTKPFLRLWGSTEPQSEPYCPNGESLGQ